jgi:hypothetical protein
MQKTTWGTVSVIETANDKIKRLEEELANARKEAATLAIFEQEAERVRSIWEPRGYVLIRSECLPPTIKMLPPARQDRLAKVLTDGSKRYDKLVGPSTREDILSLDCFRDGGIVDVATLIADPGYTQSKFNSRANLILRSLLEHGLVRLLSAGRYVRADAPVQEDALVLQKTTHQIQLSQRVVDGVMSLDVWKDRLFVNRSRLIADPNYKEKTANNRVSMIFRGLEERGLVRRDGIGRYVKAEGT